MKKVFLGGTCNGSDWRDKLKPLLKIDYFDPVVKNWTPECAGQEIVQRETCDFCLYVFTPKMLGAYAVAEVADDSNKRPEKTVLLVLNQDGDSKFSQHQYTSMMRVCNLVEKNGGRVEASLEAVADYLNGDRA